MEKESSNPSSQFTPTIPTTPSNSSSSCSSSNGHRSNGGGGGGGLPPLTPKSSTTTSPFPTTFVQADTSSFKQVVQMLTGSSKQQQHAASSRPDPSPPLSRTGPKRPSFKLYERRQSSFKGRPKINPLVPGLFNPSSSPRSPHTAPGSISPRHRRLQEVLSPSILDLPSLSLSPVTPLIPDLFHRPSSSSSEEERAIAENGFRLLPSPRTATPREADPPRLLPLFPVTSPKVAAGISSAAASSSVS